MSDVHGEVAELLGAYALHAVEPDERVLVDRHIRDCEACQSELAEFAGVTELLSVPDVADGSSAWEAIAEQIPAVSRPQFSRRRWIAVAAGVSVLVLLGVVANQHQQIGALSGQLASAEADRTSVDEQILLSQAAAAALSDVGGRLVSLGAENTASQVTIVLSDDGSGYLANHNLPNLGEGRTYQLWAVVGDQVSSVGLLGNAPGVVAFHLDPRGLTTLAVTEEVAGGVVESQNPAVVAWRAGEA